MDLDAYRRSFVRILVCGNPNATEKEIRKLREELWKQLDELGPELVIHRGTRGVGRIAGEYAALKGIPAMVFYPAWNGPFGKQASRVRDSWTFEWGKPDFVLVFPGAEHITGMARKRGIENRYVRWND